MSQRRATPRRRTTAKRRPSHGRDVFAVLGALVLVAVVAVGVQRFMEPDFAGSAACTFTDAAGGAFDLTPEQARNASIIAAVATRRDLPPRAATIGVATAMQESKLRNLTGGDRDSVGLFQQRPSQGWGTAAQIRNPVYASDRFYDALVQVPGWQTMPLTEAAQKVQISAAPDAYAQHETEATTYAEALTGLRPEGVGCRLKDSVTGPPPRQVLGNLQTETGLTADLANGSLVLQAGSRRAAATAAAWAVAGADDLGVSEVRLGGRVWRRSTGADALTWSDSGEQAPNTAVRISLLGR